MAELRDVFRRGSPTPIVVGQESSLISTSWSEPQDRRDCGSKETRLGVYSAQPKVKLWLRPKGPLRGAVPKCLRTSKRKIRVCWRESFCSPEGQKPPSACERADHGE